jgi:hypothetical protein
MDDSRRAFWLRDLGFITVAGQRRTFPGLSPLLSTAVPR